jgi:aminoglycoside 6'-N-acetyltransferase I
MAAGIAWARGRGCTEFAADALLDNEVSHAAHRALGFEEVERIVCFRLRG